MIIRMIVVVVMVAVVVMVMFLAIAPVTAHGGFTSEHSGCGAASTGLHSSSACSAASAA